MGVLAQPNSRFAGDTGAADQLTRAAMARATSQVGYVRAVVALCSSRLLLPIVATGDTGGAPDPHRHAEMSAVTLTDESGNYLLAFTGIDSLQAWDQQARPVPCLLDELAAAATASGSKLLIDPAGPTQLIIEGEPLAQLAAGFCLVEFDDGAFGWVQAAAT